MVRFETQVDELGVLGLVVVLLGLHARIRYVVDFDRKAHFLRRPLDKMSQVHNGELLGKLIVNTALSAGCGVMTGNLYASHGVANIKETACLAALAVNGKRLADGGLHAEAVQHRAEDVVVVKPIDE